MSDASGRMSDAVQRARGARDERLESAGEHRQVDWDELHARVENIGRALRDGDVATPEQARALLLRRARELARPLASGAAAAQLELLHLVVGGERYAIETCYVVEVLRHPPATPLPGAVRPVAAVVAWRGRILTALDLRAGGGTLPDRPAVLAVLGRERAELGLLADAVDGVSDVALDTMTSVPEGPTAWREYLRAMTTDAVPVLDGAALLDRHALTTPDQR